MEEKNTKPNESNETREREKKRIKFDGEFHFDRTNDDNNHQQRREATRYLC